MEETRQRMAASAARNRLASILARLRLPVLDEVPGGPRATPAALLLVVVAVAVTMFLRNPDPFLQPAFYGEDGRWMSGLLLGDTARAYLHSRRDYLVVGQIFLLDVSRTLNGILFGLDLANLPRVIAVVSYLFVGLLSAVSYAALRPWLPRGAAIAVAAGIALLPLGHQSNEVIGRILNLGYLFYPLAVALVILRPQVRSAFWRATVDAVLLVCAMTNPLVIPLLLLCLAASGLPKLAARRLPARELLLGGSLLVLCLYYIPRFASAPAQDRGTGDLAHLVEGLGGRSILYPLVFPFYERLNDALVIVLTLALVTLVAFAIRRAAPAQRSLGILLSLTTLLVVVCVMALRPGLLGILANYAHSVPDRYYQSQNIMVMMTLAWAVGTLAAGWRAPILAAVSVLYLLNVGFLFEFAAPRLPIASEGTFGDETVRSLASGEAAAGTGFVAVPIYPDPWITEVPAPMLLETARGECRREPMPECAAVPALAPPRP